ncbi:MAG TPA: addiction module protein [Pyrinomonadaceae bacterium]|nr:addiction module protein [Pyrinomonadaceae bacterium]
MSERLITRLDADPEVEDAWAAEVGRRQAEIDSGTVSLLPGPETLAKLKAKFQSKEADSSRS